MLRIEKFEEKYIDELLELYNQLLPKEKMVNCKKVSDVLNKIREYRDYYILVGVCDGLLVVTCTLIVLPNITHTQKSFAVIENVVTHRDYRKRGYATELIKYAINMAKELDCHKVVLQTRRKDEYVHEFYRKVGFDGKETTGYMINMEEEK